MGGANLGYALTKGRDFIWVVLPFVAEDGQGNQLTWWGGCGRDGGVRKAGDPAHRGAVQWGYLRRWCCAGFRAGRSR